VKTAHVVSYTHWDREFRWEFEHTRMKLVRCIDNLLDIMEGDPAYEHFLMDGQACLLDDYLEIRPENEPVVRDLVAKGRLEIGPWYTLPDCATLNGESVLRNLQYGTRVANAYGDCLKVGYNVFSFGQIAQLPQIYADFGIDVVIFYKYMNPKRSSYPEFKWEAPDGTTCLASRLGREARWNFTFAGHIPIVYARDPWHRDWRYEYGTLGKVFHTADPEGRGWFHEILDPPDDWHPEKLEEGWQRSLETVEGTAAPESLLFFDGTDFTEPHPAATEIMAALRERFGDEYEIKHSTLSAYLDELKGLLAKRDDLQTVRGPMRDGPVGAVHSDVLTIHPELKLLNARLENRLVRYAEPLSTVAWAYGIDRYPQTYLAKAWKLMFQSHPHDSIHGLGPVELGAGVAARLTQAENIAKGLERDGLGNVTKEIDTSSIQGCSTFLAVHNTCAFARTEVVEAYVDIPREIAFDEIILEDETGARCEIQELSRTEMRAGIYHPRSRNMPYYCTRVRLLFVARDVPPVGHATYKVTWKERREYPYPHDDWDPVRVVADDLLVAPRVAQNEHVRVEVNDDGTFDVIERATGEAYRGLNCLLDAGDRGNMWMSNPPDVDTVVSSRGRPADVSCTLHGSLRTSFEIRTRLPVPARFDAASGRRSDETVDLEVTTVIALRKGARYVEVATTVRNTARDHYLKACFPTGLKAKATVADGSFSVTEYSTRPDLTCELARHPAQLWFDLHEGWRGLAVLSRSTKDYEVADEDGKDTLQMGLVRSVPLRIPCDNRLWMEYPGDESSQSLGETTHRYAIMPHAKGWEESRLHAHALTFSAPLKSCQFGRQSGRLPLRASQVGVSDSSLVLSAVKKADDRDSVLVRLFNPTSRDVKTRVDVGFPFAAAHLARLSEERGERLDADDRGVGLTIGRGKIVTIEFERKT